MRLRNSPNRWGAVAQLLHWTMALGILGTGALGLWMTALKPSMTKIGVYALHKSIGLTLLGLLLLRLAWRAVDRAPQEWPAPRWQQRTARGVHLALYGLAAALPLSGWLFNSVRGYPLQWFKLFNLPGLTEKAPDKAPFFATAHEYLFWTLVLVLIVHVGAALKHHVIDRDEVLRRMLPTADPGHGHDSEGDGS